MYRYIPVVVLLNAVVNFFLLFGTNKMIGTLAKAPRILFCAVLGGVYGGVCMIPGFSFLGNTLWRLVSMSLMSWGCFGCSCAAVRGGGIFILVQFALSGFTAGMEYGGFVSAMVAVAAICLICLVGIRGSTGSCVPVVLNHNGKQLRIMALRDTGNMLRDPVTGQSVLVVGADAARELTGLTKEQLSSPVDALQTVRLPGLRLIPYRTIDKSKGLLLAMRMEEVKIGSWKGSSLVAFAPEGFGKESRYQALTGGAA